MKIERKTNIKIKGLNFNLSNPDELTVNWFWKIFYKYQARKIAKDFIEMIRKEPKYNLMEIIEDDEEIPTSYRKVIEVSRKAVFAFIYTESLIKSGENVKFVSDLNIPDKILMMFAMRWDGKELGSLCGFAANHPDRKVICPNMEI